MYLLYLHIQNVMQNKHYQMLHFAQDLLENDYRNLDANIKC